jgi:uncharacterized protein YbjT (DUF2867 family)
MQILIIGASRGTGALAVAEALRRAHSVTAFSRSGQTPCPASPALRNVRGDFHDAATLGAVIPGHDAVIITASATSLRGFKDNPNYFSQGTGLVIDAMQKSAVRRLCVLSAIGTGDSKRLLNPLLRWLLVGTFLKLPFLDHERQERLVQNSGLDWVIVRPGRLTDGAARRKYQRTAEISPVPNSISRADVADFLIESVETDAWLRKAVQIGG